MPRFLESLNHVLHRTSFEGLTAEQQADLPALLEKLRGAPRRSRRSCSRSSTRAARGI